VLAGPPSAVRKFTLVYRNQVTSTFRGSNRLTWVSGLTSATGATVTHAAYRVTYWAEKAGGIQLNPGPAPVHTHKQWNKTEIKHYSLICELLNLFWNAEQLLKSSWQKIADWLIGSQRWFSVDRDILAVEYAYFMFHFSCVFVQPHVCARLNDSTCFDFSFISVVCAIEGRVS